MDTSKEYIKMCEEAKEVQKLWKHDDGDWMTTKAVPAEVWIVCDYYSAACYHEKEKKEDHKSAHQSYFDVYSETFRRFDGGYEWEDELIAKGEDCIWLPRQDQLQEMLGGFLQVQAMLNDLDEWHRAYDARFVDIESMEQLWLCFVMKEKFNKRWEGGIWKKVS